MSINSHVQLPRFILNNFKCVDGKVQYLDLKSEELRIRSYPAQKLGTEYGYYSEAVEAFLCQNFERPFSEVVRIIVSFLNSNEETIELPLTIEDDFKKYVTSSFVRSNKAANVFATHSVTAQLLPPQSNHDALVYWSLEKCLGIMPDIKNYSMVVVENKTDIEFAVTRNCIYNVEVNKAKHIVAPVAPRCAFVLIPPGSVYKQNEHCIGNICDAEEVKQMNTMALIYEYAYNKCFIAHRDSDELNRLREYLNSYRNEIEDIRHLIQSSS